MPLCLPFSRSSSTPYQMPLLKAVGPMKRTTALYFLFTKTVSPTRISASAILYHSAAG